MSDAPAWPKICDNWCTSMVWGTVEPSKSLVGAWYIPLINHMTAPRGHPKGIITILSSLY